MLLIMLTINTVCIQCQSILGQPCSAVYDYSVQDIIIITPLGHYTLLVIKSNL